MKRRYLPVAMLVGFVFIAKSQAQTEFTELPPGMESAVKNADSEFREYICELALDFETRAQSMAIQMAVEKEITDERFDGTVFRLLRASSREGQFNDASVGVALQLLPLCKLDTDTKLTLLLDTYLAAIKQNSPARRKIVGHLKQHPVEIHRMVVERLQDDDFEIGLLSFDLLDSDRDDIHELLPIFLQAAKADDEARAARGIIMSNELIKRLNLRVSLTKAAEKLRSEGIGEESITAASALYKRYDRNGDGRISQLEYGSRTKSRTFGEDADGDGFVTFRDTVLAIEAGAKTTTQTGR